MNPIRQRRLLLIVAVLAAAAVAATLVILALQNNVSYLHTPSEVRGGELDAARRFRLGGIVCEGTLARTDGTLDVQFAVTDRVSQVPVRYSGILPDLFREGESVIATGRLQGRDFVAEEVLAKHDETYMPKEVKDAMARGAALHTTGCGAG